MLELLSFASRPRQKHPHLRLHRGDRSLDITSAHKPLTCHIACFLARFREELQRGRVEVIPKCGHVPHLEAPAATAKLIQEFLAH